MKRSFYLLCCALLSPVAFAGAQTSEGPEQDPLVALADSPNYGNPVRPAQPGIYEQITRSPQPEYSLVQYTPIFEYGKYVLRCEDNLRNLFRNWKSELVSNAKDFKLISWHYVEDIDSPEKLRHYKALLHNDDMPFSVIDGGASLECMPRNEREVRLKFEQRIRIAVYTPERDMQTLNFRERQLYKDRLGALIAEQEARLRTGLKVYRVDFRYKGENMCDYVFCDPQSRKVALSRIFTMEIGRIDIKTSKEK